MRSLWFLPLPSYATYCSFVKIARYAPHTTVEVKKCWAVFLGINLWLEFGQTISNCFGVSFQFAIPKRTSNKPRQPNFAFVSSKVIAKSP